MLIAFTASAVAPSSGTSHKTRFATSRQVDFVRLRVRAMSDNSGPAFPETCTQYDSDHEPYVSAIGGLTKRELFAMSAMQALISVPDKSFENRGKDGVPILAGYAVEYADALIKALEVGGE